VAVPRLNRRVSRYWERIKTAEAEADACWSEWAGKTKTALDAILATFFMGMIGAGLARQYQTSRAHDIALGLGGLAEKSVAVGPYLFGAVAVAVLWALLLVRWLRYMGWTRLLAMPYLLFLCALGWVLPRKLPEGADWLVLFLLQLPVVLTVGRRAHKRAPS